MVLLNSILKKAKLMKKISLLNHSPEVTIGQNEIINHTNHIENNHITVTGFEL